MLRVDFGILLARLVQSRRLEILDRRSYVYLDRRSRAGFLPVPPRVAAPLPEPLKKRES